MATGTPVASHAEPVMGTVVSFAVVPGGQTGRAVAEAIGAACAALRRADAVGPPRPISRNTDRGKEPEPLQQVMAVGFYVVATAHSPA
jgi:hypothetical protein